VKKLDTLENQAKYVYLSLGSNLGIRYRNLQKAKYWLNYFGFNIIKSSSVYETQSWPNNNFPKYLNIVIKIQTAKTVEELFKKSKLIEKKLGRKTASKNAPRICDIDILDYNMKIIDTKIGNKFLKIPHPRLTKRNFVLIPLYDVEKKWVHPILKVNIAKLLLKTDSIHLRSIKIV